MTANEVRIAEALLSLLSGGTFSPVVTFSRGYYPALEKEKLSAPVGVLIPTGKTAGTVDRMTDDARISIGLAISKSVGLVSGTTRDAEVDSLLSVAESIQDFLANRDRHTLELPASGSQPSTTARLVPPVVCDPIFDGGLLKDHGIFLSVAVFTYYLEILRA